MFIHNSSRPGISITAEYIEEVDAPEGGLTEHDRFSVDSLHLLGWRKVDRDERSSAHYMTSYARSATTHISWLERGEKNRLTDANDDEVRFQ